MSRARWLCCLLPLLAAGCDLSGGSVPIGRPGRVAGSVVYAENPDLAASGATVTVLDSAGRPHTAAADAAGTFAVEEVPAGPATIAAARDTSEGVRSLQIGARVDAGVTVSVVLSLPPPGTPTGTGQGTTSPPVTLHLGAGTAVPAPQGTTGGSLLTPSYVVEGGVGTIDAHGVFRPTTPGTGTIRVILGNSETDTTVTVLP